MVAVVVIRPITRKWRADALPPLAEDIYPAGTVIAERPAVNVTAPAVGVDVVPAWLDEYSVSIWSVVK
jgi:hypothetical protein